MGDLWLELIVILLLIVANGFFSGAEMAVVSVRRSRIDQLIVDGSSSARVVARLKEDSVPSDMRRGDRQVGQWAVVASVVCRESLSRAVI